MSEPAPRFLELFLEVMESLPRQGPGNPACAERALALCRHLPPSPQVLDLGCGTGGQTLWRAGREAVGACSGAAPGVPVAAFHGRPAGPIMKSSSKAPGAIRETPACERSDGGEQ